MEPVLILGRGIVRATGDGPASRREADDATYGPGVTRTFGSDEVLDSLAEPLTLDEAMAGGECLLFVRPVVFPECVGGARDADDAGGAFVGDACPATRGRFSAGEGEIESDRPSIS